MSWIHFEKATGRIASIGESSAPEDEAIQVALDADHDIIIGQVLTLADLGNYYVSDPLGLKIPMLRAANPATIDKTTITANGTDTATISNLPTDTVALSGDDKLEVNDGVLEVTCDTVVEFSIKCRSITHRSKVFTITAVAP